MATVDGGTTVEGGIGQTIRRIMKDVEQLVRAELRLARAEARTELTAMLKSAVLVSLGVGFGLLAVGFLLLAVMFVLRLYLSPWLAALLVAVLAGIVATAFLQGVRSRTPRPLPRTVESVQEDFEWAKQQPR